MKTTTARNASFGPYAVDVRSGELRKNGIKLRMGGQPFRILVMLLANPGEMVTREDLRAEPFFLRLGWILILAQVRGLLCRVTPGAGFTQETKWPPNTTWGRAAIAQLRHQPQHGMADPCFWPNSLIPLLERHCLEPCRNLNKTVTAKTAPSSVCASNQETS
jgi:hypothetical protein